MQALAPTLSIAAEHPYKVHVDQIRSQLAADGLATRADGVQIHILDPNGDAMARLIGDKNVGLAPGAEIHLAKEVVWYFDAHRLAAEETRAAAQAIESGGAPTAEWVIDAARWRIWDSASRLEVARKSKTGSDTEIVVIGSAYSIRGMASTLMSHIEKAPDDSAAREFFKGLGDSEQARIDGLCKWIEEALDTPRGRRLVWSASNSLETEALTAKRHGMLVLKAAGDDHSAELSDSEWSQSLANVTDGLVIVGGTAMNDPSTALDDVSTSTSGTGWIGLSAPGQDLPLGAKGEALRGTRLSAAYAAAAAALVIAESKGPLSPNQLHEILAEPGAAKDIEGIRDGAGVIDVHTAVSLAKAKSDGTYTFSATTPHLRAKLAMQVHADAPADHPYVAHIAAIRSELEARGLKSNAEGVKVIVVEPNFSPHAGAVLRTIVDPVVGLAPGAETLLITPDGEYDQEGEDALDRIIAARKGIRAGDAPSTRLAVDYAILAMLQRAHDVREVRRLHDGQSTIFANMSYGRTAFSVAKKIDDALAEAPQGSEAHAALQELPKNKDARIQHLAETVHDAVQSDAAQAQLASARAKLERELSLARKERILIFTSAGNDREPEMADAGVSQHFTNNFQELVQIGATKINDPLLPGDDVSVSWSSEGRIGLSGPGFKLPVGLDGNISGTSFASPYGIATAALMSANNSDLSPDQIDEIQGRPDVAHDIAGVRDGAGVIDPIAATSLAARAKTEDIGLSADRSQFLAKKAMRGTFTLGGAHPYLSHIEMLRSALTTAGLDANASATPIHVFESNWSDHNGAIVRTIADPKIGIAPEADVRLHLGNAPSYSAAHNQARARVSSEWSQIRAGDHPSYDLVFAIAEDATYDLASRLRQARALDTEDATQIVTLAYGVNAPWIADRLLDEVEHAPEGSKARTYIESLGDDRATQKTNLINIIAKRLHGPEGEAKLATAQSALRAELESALDQGILPIVSAGNGFAPNLDPGASKKVGSGADLLLVGATRLWDPTKISDDEMWSKSSEGASISAPGVDVPVLGSGDASGTGIAAAYTSAVAAKMLAVNPGLSARALFEILTSPEATVDLEGHTDGAGVLHPVKAIEIAKARAAALASDG